MATYCDSVQCRCNPVQEAAWDESKRSPSVAVIDAVAAAEGVDPTELDPLSGEIDLEALDRLLLNSAPDTCGVLRLCLAGWNVFVSGDGRITVCDPSDSTPLTPVFESLSAD